LRNTGLVDHQHRTRITQVINHVVTQIVTDPVGIPVRGREQPLHPVRAGLTSLLSQRPAVLALQRRQQTTQIGRYPLPRLRPREPRCDPCMHLIQASRPDRYLRHPNMISHRTQNAQPTNDLKPTRRP